MKPLNQGDLNRAASASSGSIHQQVEISCVVSAPKSIIELPPPRAYFAPAPRLHPMCFFRLTLTLYI